MVIEDISASTLSPIAFDKAKERQEDLGITLFKLTLTNILFIIGI